MLAVLPALGVTTTIGGFLRLVEPGGAVEGALSLFAVVAMLWGLWGLLLFIPIPRWMMPRWYREMKPPKQKRDKEQKQSPINLWGQE